MNELQLVDRSVVPPRAWKEQKEDGFSYRQEETGVIITAPSWSDLIKRVRAHRVANNIPIGVDFDGSIERQLAGKLAEMGAGNFTEPYVKPPKIPMPFAEWPAWAIALSILKSEADAGVGDTVERLIGARNSDRFKAWYKEKFGRDCGCSFRKDQWNMLYQYS